MQLTDWTELDYAISICHDCGKETRWERPSKRAKYLVCLSCKEQGRTNRFPCASVRCGHVDCWEARNMLGIEPGPHPLASAEPATSSNDQETTMKNPKSNKSTSKKSAAKKPASKKSASKSNGKPATKRTKKPSNKAKSKKDLPATKYCPRCEKNRKADAFYTFKRKASDGSTYYCLSAYCKPCYIATNKEWQASQAE